MEYIFDKKTYTLIPDNGIDINSLTEDEKFLIRDFIHDVTIFKDHSVVRYISKRYHLDFYDIHECKVYLCKNQIKLK